MGGILSSTPVAVPKVATPQHIRVSTGVATGLLLRKVQPNYPPLAKAARIQGHVLLQAEISKDGTIQNLKLISGHPMLAPAAIERFESLEQLRALWHGYRICVAITDHAPDPGVDTPDDLEKMRGAFLAGDRSPV